MLQDYINNGLITRRQHPEWPLSIYNYTPKCQYERAWDDVTLNMRGVIVNDETGEVLSNPFPKFFNYEEIDKKIIPKDKPIILDKLDGSLGILYWYDNIPSIATRGSFVSEQAIWATEYFRQHAVYSEFDRNLTYLFEIICPHNDGDLVVNYDTYELILIGVKSISGDVDYDIREFNLTNFNNAKVFDFDNVDFDFLKSNERENAEGFVVFYPEHSFRFKIKYETYFRKAYVRKMMSLKFIYAEITSGRDMNDIISVIPDEYYREFQNYQELLFKTYYTIYLVSLLITERLEKQGLTRKDIAKNIKDLSVKHVIFSILSKNNKVSNSIWRLVRKWLKF